MKDRKEPSYAYAIGALAKVLVSSTFL